MIRDRVVKIVLVLVGLLFTTGIYPVAMDLWPGDPSDSRDTMMSLYFARGIFPWLAVRN